MAWGRRKDTNQPYIKTGKKGQSGAGTKTDSVSDVHMKEKEHHYFCSGCNAKDMTWEELVEHGRLFPHHFKPATGQTMNYEALDKMINKREEEMKQQSGSHYKSESKIPKDVMEMAEDWWRAISEQGLAGDIMSSSHVYPSKVESFEEGDPVAFDEFTEEEQMKLIERAGGIEGMKQKLIDEGYLEEEEY